MKKVSIIMGIYNCDKYLQKSIDSIVAQSFSDWEFIICDDGSTDESYKIAKQYAEKYPDKFIILQNERNKGLNYTLNKCIKNATGEYIARQDGDDLSKTDRLELQVKFLDSHLEYSVVGTNACFFDERGSWGETHFKGEVTRMNFVRGVPFIHPTTMMRRDALLSVGGYSDQKSLLRVEDYHLWFKFYLKGYKGFNINKNLYDYRDDRDSIKRRTVRNRINVFRLMLWGYKRLDIPFKYYYIPFLQIGLIFVPEKISNMIHRQKWK